MLAGTSVASDRSATRVDIALLVSALFLQRFSLPFGDTFLQLSFVVFGFILLHQFLSGKLLIQYDRLLWFLGAALAISCSLLLNFKSTMLTSYFQFMIFYFLFTLRRPSTSDQYKRTLQAFQFLVMILSCLAVVQFLAQFVVDARELVNFYGILPDFLFGFARAGGQATSRMLEGSSIIKSNGIFLGEPSTLSQITALGILIEVLEFRRPRYLLVMALGFLVAYSGTGLMTLLLFLPLTGLRDGRAGLSALLVVMFVLGLFATGIIDPSAFVSRVGEFQDTRASGFQRLVSPFWLAAKQIDTASLQALLLGSGPGTVTAGAAEAWYTGGYASPWVKMFYEYGIIGLFIISCCLAFCLKGSRCPGLVLAAIIFSHLFLEGEMSILIVLCTLSGPRPRRGRINEPNQYRSSLVAGSATG